VCAEPFLVDLLGVYCQELLLCRPILGRASARYTAAGWGGIKTAT
jgi:hypothetical protein